ncbi:MAG: hypothetical protein RQ982_08500 [Gammaproteobacteria bacterium]|nr:hypothetical protein [Gammaproteobacteria bacterium]
MIKCDTNRGEIRTIGYMSHKTITHATSQGITVGDATITISDDRLRRMLKPKKRRSGKALVPDVELLKLPHHVANPKAILWSKKDKSVLYVFDTKGQAETAGKFIVKLNFKQSSDISNSVRSSGVVSLRNLKDKNAYEVIDGEL